MRRLRVGLPLLESLEWYRAVASGMSAQVRRLAYDFTRDEDYEAGDAANSASDAAAALSRNVDSLIRHIYRREGAA